MMRRPARGEVPLYWVGSSKRDLLAFPEAVKDSIGTALSIAQFGGKHPAAKPWKGKGSGVLEVMENYDGDAYRAVYTVRFPRSVYVLHCFQKKVAHWNSDAEDGRGTSLTASETGHTGP